MRSHSRPKFSNDNPFSESWFKTLKYMPAFPERFGSLEHARDFVGRFVQVYNSEHRHSGLGFHTPSDVHYGLTGHVDDQRLAALEAVWAAHLERFGKHRSPKKLRLPEAAWINELLKQEKEGELMLA